MATTYHLHHLGFGSVSRPLARQAAPKEFARSRKSDRKYASSNLVLGNFRHLDCDLSAHDLRPDDLQPLRSCRFSCTIRASCAQKFDGRVYLGRCLSTKIIAFLRSTFLLTTRITCARLMRLIHIPTKPVHNASRRTRQKSIILILKYILMECATVTICQCKAGQTY